MGFIKQLLRYFNPFGGLNVASDAVGGELGTNLGNIANGFADKAEGYINSQTGGVTERDKAMMEYQTSERQAAQDWTAQREDTELQRRVADLKAAGINPMMAAGGGVSSSSSGQSAPSSAPAASLSEIFELATLRPRIDLMKAQAENLRSQAHNRDLLTPEQIKKIQQDMKESDARIDELAAREQKEYSDIDVNIAKAAALWSESNLYDVEADKYAALTDSQIKLNEARGKESESQASLNFMNALYQSKLVKADMPEKVAAKVVAETAQAYKNASVAEQEAARKEIENSIKTGTWTKTQSKEGTFWDRCVMHFDRATSLLGNILSIHN